jgi:hypothetical protein
MLSVLYCVQCIFFFVYLWLGSQVIKVGTGANLQYYILKNVLFICVYSCLQIVHMYACGYVFRNPVCVCYPPPPHIQHVPYNYVVGLLCLGLHWPVRKLYTVTISGITSLFSNVLSWFCCTWLHDDDRCLTVQAGPCHDGAPLRCGARPHRLSHAQGRHQYLRVLPGTGLPQLAAR